MGTRTIGAYTFDVYGDAAGLTEYATGSAAYYATFSAATADTVARTHVEATRLIQRMPFADAADAVVATADTDVVTACYELTLAALADAAVLTQTTTAKNIKSVSAKGSGVEFFAPTKGGRFPVRVTALLATRLESTTSTLSGGAYSSGTSTCSDFDDSDRYGLTSA